MSVVKINALPLGLANLNYIDEQTVKSLYCTDTVRVGIASVNSVRYVIGIRYLLSC